jgi:hypothetical protein
LAFHFRNRFMRRIDIHECEMGFAVLLYFIGEVLDAPIFGFLDRTAIVLDDGLVGLDKALELLRGNILAAE